MDTSRVDQERIAVNLNLVQVLRVVHTILEIIEPTIVRERRTIEVRVTEDIVVCADDLRLRQVLLNLVSNALKYTPVASPIIISAERVIGNHLSQRIPSYFQADNIPPHKQFVAIAVRDRGRGIGVENQQRLFTKFTRLPDAITSKQRGSGLGLFLCRQLVEGMDGHIWIESQGIEGEGSTFLVALPEYSAD
jgi:signal transduction histidine kinase